MGTLWLQPHTILYRSFWNFVHVFSRVCRRACGLDIVFKFIFVTFSTLTLSFFLPQILWKSIDCGYLLSTTSHASYENMHVLSMKFLCATSISPKFDIYFYTIYTFCGYNKCSFFYIIHKFHFSIKSIHFCGYNIVKCYMYKFYRK